MSARLTIPLSRIFSLGRNYSPYIDNNTSKKQNSDIRRYYCSTTDGGGKKFKGNQFCSECGGELFPVSTINSSNKFYHCKSCNSVFASTVKQLNQLIEHQEQPRKLPNPREITQFLDKYVIGQDIAKKVLSTGVYQHYLRVEHNQAQNKTTQLEGNSPNSSSIINIYSNKDAYFDNNNNSMYNRPVIKGSTKDDDDNNIQLDKSNIILLGPSGVGKTHISKTLAKILNVPMALCDCTSLTQAGYVGEDVESVLTKLLINANGNIEKAQQGIVFLDEIDKIASTSDSANHTFRDVGGEGVQHALLKLCEGTIANVKNGKKTAGGQQDTVQIDTKDILFIGSGAFVGIEKVVAKRFDERFIGFGGPKQKNENILDKDLSMKEQNERRDKLILKTDQDDLIKYGIIPELVGRFPIIVPFHSFDKNTLVRILKEPKNSLIQQKQLMFAMYGSNLTFSDEALEEIAEMALNRKTGARALRSIIERVLREADFVVPESDIVEVHVNKDCVKGKGTYQFTKKNVSPMPVTNNNVKEPKTSHYFSQKDIEKYKECYNLYIKNEVIKSDSQLRFLMRSLGFSPTLKESKDYIKNYNYNIDFPTFLEILYDNQQKCMPIEEISKGLLVLDTFNESYISVTELVMMLHNFGEKMSFEEIEGILQDMNVKGNSIPHDILIEYVSSIN
uniref:ClpX-type ZB domain-containing protein n=1 Tax=Strongyloides stercoralis TaxID=6248 RepID=A0AAF5I1Z1_STRER